jgi:hypothetical protein
VRLGGDEVGGRSVEILLALVPAGKASGRDTYYLVLLLLLMYVRHGVWHELTTKNLVYFRSGERLLVLFVRT